MRAENTEEKLLVGFQQLADFLTSEGFPIARATVAKYCSPAIDTGPPVDSYWGVRPTFRPSHVKAWARSRLKPANRMRRTFTQGSEPAQ